MATKHHKYLAKNMYDNIALLYLFTYFLSITWIRGSVWVKNPDPWIWGKITDPDPVKPPDPDPGGLANTRIRIQNPDPDPSNIQYINSIIHIKNKCIGADYLTAKCEIIIYFMH